MSMAAIVTPDPAVVTGILREHNGEFAFSDLLKALRDRGLSETASRDLIWRLLAHGVVQFTTDRDRIRLAQSQKAVR